MVGCEEPLIRRLLIRVCKRAGHVQLAVASMRSRPGEVGSCGLSDRTVDGEFLDRAICGLEAVLVGEGAPRRVRDPFWVVVRGMAETPVIGMSDAAMRRTTAAVPAPQGRTTFFEATLFVMRQGKSLVLPGRGTLIGSLMGPAST